MYNCTKNDISDDERSKINHLLNKFTYEIRESSREFCKKITTIYINNNAEELISSIIKNQNWYLAQWDKDPTIKAMLIMLDTIQEKVKNKNIDNIMKNLKVGNEKIYFYFIETTTFGNADELYIKMNSRGKRLTTFENFKSKLETLITEANLDKNFKEDFKKNIDNKWINYFFKMMQEDKKNQEISEEDVEKIDNWIMNLFMTILENDYALKSISNGENESIRKEEIASFDDFILQRNDKKIDFDKLLITNETIKQSCYILDYFSNLRNINENDKYLELLNKTVKCNYKEYVLKRIMNTSGNDNNDFRPEKIQFYVISKFLYTSYEKNQGKELSLENEKELSKLLYFTRNIVQNTYIDSEDKFCKMIMLIDQIMEKSFEIGIFEYFNNEKSIENLGKIFSNEVKYLLEGESKKIRYILQNGDWKIEILKMDSNEYLKGNTQFLFEFIESSDNKLELYKNYSQKIRAIFYQVTAEENNEDESELREEKERRIDPIINNDQYYFKRALLTRGNYLYEYGGRSSFLTYSDKYYSWKNFLTEEKYKSAREVFHKLLDELDNRGIKYDIKYESNLKELKDRIGEKLKEIVENYQKTEFITLEEDNYPKDKNGNYIFRIGNWREYYIKYPKLFEIAQNMSPTKIGFVKFLRNDNNEDNQIIITTSKASNSNNWDFYTYCLKIRIEDILKDKIKSEELKYKHKHVHNSIEYIEYNSNKFGKIQLICNDKLQYNLKIKENENVKRILNKEPRKENVESYYIFEYETEKEIIEDFEMLILY